METDGATVQSRCRRRRTGPRLLEKQIRPEVLERCLQFIDVAINEIIYQENIYPTELFASRQMYRLLVHQCTDKDISSYVALCIASLRDLLSQQLIDMVAINITRNSRVPVVLRRYLIELHIIHDPCLRAVYDDAPKLINQLDQTFAQCIHAIKRISPLENRNHAKRWTFQMRSCHHDQSGKFVDVADVLHRNPIYKEFILIEEQVELLSSGKQSKISTIRSWHNDRLKLQLLCEDDRYEQDRYHRSMKSESDDVDESQVLSDDSDSNESKVVVLNTTEYETNNGSALRDVDSIVDRYELMRTSYYSSDDEDDEQDF